MCKMRVTKIRKSKHSSCSHNREYQNKSYNTFFLRLLKLSKFFHPSNRFESTWKHWKFLFTSANATAYLFTCAWNHLNVKVFRLCHLLYLFLIYFAQIEIFVDEYLNVFLFLRFDLRAFYIFACLSKAV